MSRSSPRVSVIIPTWNRANTLLRAIESVLTQEGAGTFEVLVCDDGSDDDSRARVEELGDARVRWIDGPRSGRPAVPRNRGLMHGQGEWLAFLDSDDWWLPGKLERQLARMAQFSCRASCTNAMVFRENGEHGAMVGSVGSRITFSALLRGNLIVCSSVVVHRSLLRQARGFPQHPDLTAIEDYALWLRIASLSDFAYLDEPLVAYTDAPATSIRAGDVREGPAQRARVFADYRCWAPSFSWHRLLLHWTLARASLRALKRAAQRPRCASSPS